MADIVEAAAAPAEKIVETIAKPIGMAATVRKIPDWVWIVLTVAVAYYAYRWWKRRQMLRAIAIEKGNATRLTPAPPAPQGPTQATTAAPAPAAPATPAGTVTDVQSMLGPGLQNIYVPRFTNPYESTPYVVDHPPPPDGTIY